MSMGPIRLVLAGSDVRMRDRVQDVVAIWPQIVVVNDVTDGKEAIVAVEEFGPDVLVLDMQIQGVHACSVTRKVLTLRPQLGIVVWIEIDDSMELPDDQARTMQRAGVCCVDTSADYAEIEQAIVCASAGKAFLSHRLTLRRSLTPREQEVLGYLAAGWTPAQTARALLITPSTVSSHMARICRKLGVASRADAAEAGRDLGLGCDLAAAADLGAYYATKRPAYNEFYQARDASGL